jgi:hypothetical protein
MRGTVADNARPGVRSPLERVPGMLRRGRPSLLEARALEPAARDSSCQYVLDRREEGGGLSGTSICDGLPQQTRLEVPAVADALLTRSELVTVLVAFLSAPPLASAEPFPRPGETAPADADF